MTKKGRVHPDKPGSLWHLVADNAGTKHPGLAGERGNKQYDIEAACGARTIQIAIRVVDYDKHHDVYAGANWCKECLEKAPLMILGSTEL